MAKSGGSGGRGFSIARSFGGRGFTQSEYVSNYNRTSSAMGKNGGNNSGTSVPGAFSSDDIGMFGR